MSTLPRVDLRSDTVTQPCAAMKEAMMSAPLGDDVLGDEPTVQKLEELAAEMLGMEAAVFVPSGTMGNQIGIAAHTRPGDSILAEDEAHILYYEVGAPAVLNGVTVRTYGDGSGYFTTEHVESRGLVGSLHTPGTTLLCLENTHNRAGGTVLPVERHRELRDLADRKGWKVHLDGARVFNASVALGLDVSAITSQVDSVSICLSKGLGAPVGSVLAGKADFIDRARLWRKRVGGGMRQSGILAAAGIFALENNVSKLADDHRRAKEFTNAISGLPGLHPQEPETNIVMVRTESDAQQWIDGLEKSNVHAFALDPQRMRFVFHLDVDDAGLAQAIQAFRSLAVEFS
ncbi:MAG: aminotransferase class I/II-fold pyridoxal phosphate-dependent enzyme [Armatimonadetes bacterium]|nr:aminotransferase class I/II-fold pyridoxal phosphate-dependent enzyme [Armatimonadota bacterium]